jgi:hypothetical protein
MTGSRMGRRTTTTTKSWPDGYYGLGRIENSRFGAAHPDGRRFSGVFEPQACNGSMGGVSADVVARLGYGRPPQSRFSQ